jgi:hypothetical protein
MIPEVWRVMFATISLLSIPQQEVKADEPTVLICLGYCSSIPWTGNFNNRNLLSPSSGGWNAEIRVPAWFVSGEGSLSGLHMTTFLLCPHMSWGRASYLVSLLKVLTS